MIGKTIGHYRIAEKIGAGGMGEVYRAHDAKLGREVAIKVLPDEFAHDPERLARFDQEARLLAALNHSNIAAIYGLEESEGEHYLVLELVPGETLAERLARGPLAIEEALEVCRQIAEALEAAHERGIIHRDLKPANVKVTPEGKAKVLDFGLAKAFAAVTATPDPAHSPTATYRGSRAGVILGTAAYMSPEQARGKPLDRRTDIWSFGCVLYEALTGRQAFAGETISDMIAAILDREPEWQALPAATPGKVRDLLRHCLQKDPHRRLRDIWDARISIEDALISPGATLSAAAVPRPASRHRSIGWALAGSLAILLALAVFVAVWNPEPRQGARPVMRFVVPIPPGEVLPSTVFLTIGLASGLPAIALSPDGSRLVHAGGVGGKTRLYMRSTDRLESTPVTGTEGALGPFFSPDGQWVGFFAQGKMKKVPVTGGMPVVLCDATDGRGASWGPDDTVLFAPDPGSGIWSVPASGGTPRLVVAPDRAKGEISYRLPAHLPEGRAFMFTIKTEGITSFDEARIAVYSLETGTQRALVEGATHARYAPTGHLIFGRGGALLAAPFDLAKLRMMGPAVPIVQGVMTSPDTGVVQYAISENGTLLYSPGELASLRTRLVWVDRAGKVDPITADPRPFFEPHLSPDGTRVAVGVAAANDKIWIYELERDTLTRLTFSGGNDSRPRWTRDGLRLAFGSDREGASGIFRKDASGSGPEERVLTGQYPRVPSSWSPDGNALLFEERHPETGWDIWTLPLEGERTPKPFLRSPFEEFNAQFSPDGRWVAYQSNESGRDEIYARPYPNPGGKWQISNDGGFIPVWRRDGKELFYRAGDKMMAVAVRTTPTFGAGTPRLLFDRARLGRDTSFDVAPDGQRFLMIQEAEQQPVPTQMNFVLNWFEELKRLVPPGKD